MMKSAAMADNAADVQQLGVVRELEVHGDGRPLFDLTGQDQTQPGRTEVRRFAAVLNISAVFEYAHLNGNRDPMSLPAALRFAFGLFDQNVSREGGRHSVSTFFAAARRQSIQQTQISRSEGNFSDAMP